MSELTISRDAWDDAKELGIVKELPELLRTSVKTNSEIGHRRHEDYYFVIEGSEVVAINTPDDVVLTTDEVIEPQEDSGRTILRMDCPYCREGEYCAVCEGSGKVSGTHTQLISMLEETSV